MCSPELIMLGISIGASGASYQQQYQGQKAQASAQRKVQKQSTEAENQRYLNEVSSMRKQQAQQQVAMAQRLQDNKKKAMKARASARVSASGAGVAGLSVDSLINDISRREAEYAFSEEQNMQMGDVNRQLQLRDAGLSNVQTRLRINRPIQEANAVGAALTGLQTGLSVYSMGTDAVGTKPKKEIL